MSYPSTSTWQAVGLKAIKRLLQWPLFAWERLEAPFATLLCYWRGFWAFQVEKLQDVDERGQFEESDQLLPTVMVSDNYAEPNLEVSRRAMDPLEGPIFSHKESDIPAMVVSSPTPKGTDEVSETAASTPGFSSHRRRVHSVTGSGGSENGKYVEHMGSIFLQGEDSLDKEITELQSDFFEVRKEWPRESNQYFIPADDLRRLVTLNTILNQLRFSRADLCEQDLRQRAECACASAYKLFAILVCANKNNKFYEFLDEELCDADLPFRRSPDAGHNGYLCSSRPPYNVIRSMKSWGLYQVSNFSRDQWQMLSPIFKGNLEVEHYELLNNHVLPFIEDHEQETGEFTGFGGFSSVWAVLVHPAHQYLYKSTNSNVGDEEKSAFCMHWLTSQVKNPRLAIKRLHSTEENDFEVEVEMLKAFSNHSNPHLVKLLATYRWQGRYHLIFPYARSNLRKYWETTPTPEFSRATISWMLCQCKGVAAGLYAIHEYKNSERKQQATLGSDLPHRRAKKDNRYGRHGDIKPENILWSDEDVNHGLGLLLIADFGLMEFHRKDSRSKVRPDSIIGSPTYAPPELELRLHISPAYDIWSLGCVFLEFAIWLVIGLQELEGFPEARAHTVTDGLNNDTFFTILNGEDPRRHAIVRPGVSGWIQKLHRAPHCTAFVHEFLDLISNDMLVVEASERINCGALNTKLATMLTQADKDPAYLTQPSPWRERDLEHLTVATDLAPSGQMLMSPPPSPNVGTALPRCNATADLDTRPNSRTREP